MTLLDKTGFPFSDLGIGRLQREVWPHKQSAIDSSSTPDKFP